MRIVNWPPEILQQINVPKILDLKSPSEQIFSKNWRWVHLLIDLLGRTHFPDMNSGWLFVFQTISSALFP